VALNGLNAGEVVVQTGQLMVIPGQPVTIIPSAALTMQGASR
jgi:hypothetical protein